MAVGLDRCEHGWQSAQSPATGNSGCARYLSGGLMSHRSGAGALARGRLLRAGLALLALVLFAALSVDRAQGASVAPVTREGETVCTDVKSQRKQLLVAPVVGTGTFDDGTLS